MGFPTPLRELSRDLAALLWPTECVGCGAPDRDCCARCRAALRAPPDVVEVDLGVDCFVAGSYEGALAALLVAFKHAGRVSFARILGERLRSPLLAALARCSGPLPPVIVTVPSRRKRIRQRGYRHVEMLVGQALRAPATGARIAALRIPALRAARGRRGQVGLDAHERARNAARVAVRRSVLRVIRGREVVLVDDLITTGASVLAARSALEAHGARVVAVVALGVTERRDTR